MADVELPGHVVSRRRDGRRDILLHRSLAVISPTKIEIRAARSAAWLPLLGVFLVLGIGTAIALTEGRMPFPVMVVLLFFCLLATPLSVMGLVSAFLGADVVVDATKGSITFQQGFLGMGVGTRDLVPFAKIDHLEVTIEGDQPDRWGGQADALRQFALVLVKVSGKRLTLAQVPVPVRDQEDGMDRVLSTGYAIAGLAGTTVRIPEGWELQEVDASTGAPLPAPTSAAKKPRRKRRG